MRTSLRKGLADHLQECSSPGPFPALLGNAPGDLAIIHPQAVHALSHNGFSRTTSVWNRVMPCPGQQEESVSPHLWAGHTSGNED